MEENMDIDASHSAALPLAAHASGNTGNTGGELNYLLDWPPDLLNEHDLLLAVHIPTPQRDNFRDIQVKVHIRRPERDTWVYMGRGLVTQETIPGQPQSSTRVGAYFSALSSCLIHDI
jgi:hypothetical protein